MSSSVDSVSNVVQLGKEDVFALATFPIAAVFFACATGWLNSVHKHANKPLNAKIDELNKLKQEAEQLNRSSTILLHGKKMREVTKLEDEITVMRQRRNTTRRRVILSAFYYGIQAIGLVILYFASKKFGHQNSVVVGTSLQSSPLEEIVMVPHFLTSYWVEEDKRTGMIRRSAFPIIGQVRSIGFVGWYVLCLITVRVLAGAFSSSNGKVVKEGKEKKE